MPPVKEGIELSVEGTGGGVVLTEYSVMLILTRVAEVGFLKRGAGGAFMDVSEQQKALVTASFSRSTDTVSYRCCLNQHAVIFISIQITYGANKYCITSPDSN